VLAALVLFLPAADRAHAVPVASDCVRCRRRRRILAAMDWLRRLRFVDGMGGASGSATTAGARAEHRRHHRLSLRDPDGHALTGIAAVRRLVLLLAPAIWLALTVLRSGAGVLDPAAGADAALLAIAGCLALWTPGLVRRASPARGRVAR
jgi:hypothetical protein